LILALLIPGNLFSKYIKPVLFWSIALTKFCTVWLSVIGLTCLLSLL
jgi:TRAP-type C4-dicarboxylate transport system permease small subunit